MISNNRALRADEVEVEGEITYSITEKNMRHS